MTFTGRAIYLPKDEVEFIRVAEIENDQVIRRNRVYADDLIESFFELMYVPQCMNFLLRTENFIENVLVPCVEYFDREPSFIHIILKHFKGYLEANYLDHREEIYELFQTFIRYFLNENLMADEAAGLLIRLIEKLKSEENASQIEDLFVMLLERIDLAGSASLSLLEKTVSQLYKFKAEEKINSFAKLLRSYENKKIICSSPILPKGTLTYQEDNKGNYYVAIQVASQQRDVYFYKTLFEKVGHPNLIFIFIVATDKSVKAKLFAVKDTNVKHSTRLYHYPFANVYGDGSCCWPELNQIRIEEAIQLHNLIYLYFNSPHNNHLFNGENLREVLNTLSGKDFDHKKLKPVGTTFGTLLQVIKPNHLTA